MPKATSATTEPTSEPDRPATVSMAMEAVIRISASASQWMRGL